MGSNLGFLSGEQAVEAPDFGKVFDRVLQRKDQQQAQAMKTMDDYTNLMGKLSTVDVHAKDYDRYVNDINEIGATFDPLIKGSNLTDPMQQYKIKSTIMDVVRRYGPKFQTYAMHNKLMTAKELEVAEAKKNGKPYTTYTAEKEIDRWPGSYDENGQIVRPPIDAPIYKDTDYREAYKKAILKNLEPKISSEDVVRKELPDGQVIYESTTDKTLTEEDIYKTLPYMTQDENGEWVLDRQSLGSSLPKQFTDLAESGAFEQETSYNVENNPEAFEKFMRYTEEANNAGYDDETAFKYAESAYKQDRVEEMIKEAAKSSVVNQSTKERKFKEADASKAAREPDAIVVGGGKKTLANFTPTVNNDNYYANIEAGATGKDHPFMRQLAGDASLWGAAVGTAAGVWGGPGGIAIGAPAGAVLGNEARKIIETSLDNDLLVDENLARTLTNNIDQSYASISPTHTTTAFDSMFGTDKKAGNYIAGTVRVKKSPDGKYKFEINPAILDKAEVAGKEGDNARVLIDRGLTALRNGIALTKADANRMRLSELTEAAVEMLNVKDNRNYKQLNADVESVMGPLLAKPNQRTPDLTIRQDIDAKTILSKTGGVFNLSTRKYYPNTEEGVKALQKDVFTDVNKYNKDNPNTVIETPSYAPGNNVLSYRLNNMAFANKPLAVNLTSVKDGNPVTHNLIFGNAVVPSEDNSSVLYNSLNSAVLEGFDTPIDLADERIMAVRKDPGTITLADADHNQVTVAVIPGRGISEDDFNRAIVAFKKKPTENKGIDQNKLKRFSSASPIIRTVK